MKAVENAQEIIELNFFFKRKRKETPRVEAANAQGAKLQPSNRMHNSTYNVRQHFWR